MSQRNQSAARIYPAYSPDYQDYDYDDEQLYHPAQPRPAAPRIPQATGYRVVGASPAFRPDPAAAPSMRPRAYTPAPPAEQPYRATPHLRSAPRAYTVPKNSADTSRWLIIGMGLLVMLVGSYLLVSFAVTSWQSWQDDLSYGRPRLTRLEAPVGHNETLPGAKTTFIAQNLRGQISIIEIPGGDASKTRVIIGPQLYGKDRENIPVKISIRDINGDSQPDLLATAQEQQIAYINENGSFRPINEQERAKLATS